MGLPVRFGGVLRNNAKALRSDPASGIDRVAALVVHAESAGGRDGDSAGCDFRATVTREGIRMHGALPVDAKFLARVFRSLKELHLDRDQDLGLINRHQVVSDPLVLRARGHHPERVRVGIVNHLRHLGWHVGGIQPLRAVRRGFQRRRGRGGLRVCSGIYCLADDRTIRPVSDRRQSQHHADFIHDAGRFCRENSLRILQRNIRAGRIA